MLAVSEDISSEGILRFSHSAMAAHCEIYCAHFDEQYAQQAAMHAFDLAGRLEQELSRFVENSDISRINHLAAGESLRVGISTMDCLEIARFVYAETDGAFDVSIGTGFENLELVPEEYMVRAHAAGIRLDLGGIGKGYAVDRMAEMLEDWEVGRALLHAGFSSVVALAPPVGRGGWPLSLSVPEGGLVLTRISANGHAVSGSGIRKKDHIINPKAKQPARLRSAVWVAGPRSVLGNMSVSSRTALDAKHGKSPAAVADALSTAFMILSEKEIEEFCRRVPGLEAWSLEAPGRELTVPSLRHYPAPHPGATR